jgi:hypothetical protein
MDIISLIDSILIGFFVLYFYVLLLPKSKNVWAGIKNKCLKNFITLSVFLSGICYMILWVYHVFYKQDEILYTIGNLIFLFGALLWPIFLFLNLKWGVFFSLCLTSLGALLILIQQCYEPKILYMIVASYLLFHVLIMDNTVWTWNFFSIEKSFKK